MARPAPPRVFVSFAGDDRKTAVDLSDDLRDRGVETFLDEQDVRPGENVVLAVDLALTQSDYYVLLWSFNTRNQPWVDAQWSAALAREVRERRSFLFVVQLDGTPLPQVLAPRKALDASRTGRAELVDRLVMTWRRDRALGVPVLPAPRRRAEDKPTTRLSGLNGLNGHNGAEIIVVYVRNRDLGVAHLVAVPATATGREFKRRTHAELDLQEGVTEFGGVIGARFRYRFMHAGQAISDNDTLRALGITEDTVVRLEADVDFFSPKGVSTGLTLRHLTPRQEEARVTPPQIRALLDQAFGHLKPWRRPSDS